MKRYILLTTLILAVLTASAQRVRKGQSNIIILGDTTEVRAMSSFTSAVNCLDEYAEVANLYHRHFNGAVRIYCMPIPYSSEFYGKDVTGELTRSQKEPIERCFGALCDSVFAVDVVDALGEHAAEPIYSRTDHHWTPLGAYYAAKRFAEIADVPFRDISEYEERVVHNFVGTMYNWSKCIDVKKYPEDFVFYVPQGVDYSATFIDYTLDKTRRRVIKESEPHTDEFFRKYNDGAGAAYCTFMGGDTKLVKVTTGTRNNRRLLILKDSYGNALPGYLFHSFEEICVVDCRYFTKNLTDYVSENRITDILFANNIGHASTKKTTDYYRNYLVQ